MNIISKQTLTRLSIEYDIGQGKAGLEKVYGWLDDTYGKYCYRIKRVGGIPGKPGKGLITVEVNEP